MLKTALTVLMMSVLLFGCASLTASKKIEVMEGRQRQFSKALRWGAYDMAASLIRKRDAEAAAPDLAGLENIRVTRYEEMGSSLNPDKTEAFHTVIYHFYDSEHGSVHTLRQVQHWWYDESTRDWYLDGDLPDFKAAMRH